MPTAEHPPQFVYQAYGASRFRIQAALSIRSLRLHGVPAENILVFSDDREVFHALAGRVLDATPELLRQWAGPCNFCHRVKIELLRHAYKEHGGPLIYVDGDTFWRAPPTAICSRLASGQYLMHVCEGPLSDSFHPEYRKALRHLKAAGRLKIESDVQQIQMYNAGVIGLPRQVAGDVLDEALTLSDELMLEAPRSMELVEQVAFSCLLPQRGVVSTCEREVLHYWRDAFEVMRAIDACSPEELQRISNNLTELEGLIVNAKRNHRRLPDRFRKRAVRLTRLVGRQKRAIKGYIQRLTRRAA
jgi:hypothetical protein